MIYTCPTCRHELDEIGPEGAKCRSCGATYLRPQLQSNSGARASAAPNGEPLPGEPVISRPGRGKPDVQWLIDGMIVAAAKGEPGDPRELPKVAEHLYRQLGPVLKGASVKSAVKKIEDRLLRKVLEDARQGGTQPPAAELLIRVLADVGPERVEWIWQDRIARGKVTLISGDPGVGKSWLGLAIAAAVTNGVALPGDGARYEPMSVLVLNAEDGVADTIRPRAERMGADLRRITVLDAIRGDDGRERFPHLERDLPQVEALLDRGGFGILLVDPIAAYLGGIDTHRDADLRAVLGPLAHVADRHGVAVVAVGHLTKGTRERAIYRPQGSIATIAAARVAILVARHPDDERQRVVAVAKSNLALVPGNVAFTIDEGQFRWCTTTMTSPEALLAAPSEDERSAMDEAASYLSGELAEGSQWAVEVTAGSRRLGISERTLRRARATLGVVVGRASNAGGPRGAGRWFWHLPADPHTPPPAADKPPTAAGQGSTSPDPRARSAPQHNGRLGHLGHLDEREGPDPTRSESVGVQDDQGVQDGQRGSRRPRDQAPPESGDRAIEGLDDQGGQAPGESGDLAVCSRCGQPVSDDPRLDPDDGALLCAPCDLSGVAP